MCERRLSRSLSADAVCDDDGFGGVAPAGVDGVDGRDAKPYWLSACKHSQERPHTDRAQICIHRQYECRIHDTGSTNCMTG
jgi:hypothetical protein